MPTNSARAGISSSMTCVTGSRRRSGLPVAGDGGVDRVVDAEHLGQPGDLQHLEDPALGADEGQFTIVAPDPLQPADQHAEPGRVEELDTLEIDHDPAVPLVNQLDQLFPELR